MKIFETLRTFISFSCVPLLLRYNPIMHPYQRIRQINRALCSFVFLILLGGCGTGAVGPYAVNRPYVDLRSQPFTQAAAGVQDKLQETQLLYGEPVHIIRREGDWAYIEAPQQPEFSHHNYWQGYPGWIPFDSLTPNAYSTEASLIIQSPWVRLWTSPQQNAYHPEVLYLGSQVPGSIDSQHPQLWRLRLLDGRNAWIPFQAAFGADAVFSPSDARYRIIRTAALFLGHYYYWGGRTPNNQSQNIAMGVDCSALTHLAYRLAGMGIPRDSHEQFLQSARIENPQTGDLIFLSAKDNPNRIVHVMLYAGNSMIIEGPGTGQLVRRISVKERLGLELEHLFNGVLVNGQTLYFGSFFSES